MHYGRQRCCISGTRRWSLPVVLFAAWSVTAIAQDTEPAKSAVPTAARQAEVRKLLDETFELSKASTPAKKQLAAQKLMEMAGDPATAGDELYVVLVTALPLLREAGDFPTSLAAIGQLIESFQVDADAERTKHVTDFMTACKSSTTLEPVLNEVVALVGRAARENRYRAANELLDAADKQAKKITATKLLKSLTEVRGTLREREQAFVAQTQAQKTLTGKPDDPKANFAVGLWLAVYESNWELSLPKLVLGSDAKWKSAATAEPKSPSEVDGQLSAADAWWEVAQSATGEAKLAAQRRAHEWYERHEPNAKSPLVKARVTKRLDELAANLEPVSQRTLTSSSQPKPANNTASKTSKANELPVGKWIDLLEMVKLPEHAQVGKWQRNGEAIRCEPASDARFMVPVALRGSYELDCEFTRQTGSETAFIVLPIGISSCSVILSGWGGFVSGLHLVDGRECNAIDVSTGAATRPGKLLNNKRYKLRIEVIQDDDRVTVQADLDELRFVSWKGRASQLSNFGSHIVPCSQAVGVGAHQGQLDVHKLTLRLKPGYKAYRLGDDWKNPLAPVLATPPKEIDAKCITWRGRKYFISDKTMGLPEAKKLSVQLQGRLLTISSRDEETFICEQGRGSSIWLGGWRQANSDDWRDERNRSFRFKPTWSPGQPSSGGEVVLAIRATTAADRGLHDVSAHLLSHACIEWGEEYPDDK